MFKSRLSVRPDWLQFWNKRVTPQVHGEDERCLFQALFSAEGSEHFQEGLLREVGGM